MGRGIKKKKNKISNSERLFNESLAQNSFSFEQELKSIYDAKSISRAYQTYPKANPYQTFFTLHTEAKPSPQYHVIKKGIKRSSELLNSGFPQK